MYISCHNFMFPFRWNVKLSYKDLFSSQIDLSSINFSEDSPWIRHTSPTEGTESENWYNEHNYFYGFTHHALYDSGNDISLLRHFERREPMERDVTYEIECSGKVYSLKVRSISLKLYSTGVGVLSFYLLNKDYSAHDDILNINQFGRRVFPPYLDSINTRELLADKISLEGLDGKADDYSEDFCGYGKDDFNQPAKFIIRLIKDIATNIFIEPVIDDRMFVQCLYMDRELAEGVPHYGFGGDEDPNFRDFWYKFLFVDKDGKNSTCGNRNMRMSLLNESTYDRWQDLGTLYGVSRYSMVCLITSDSDDFVFNYFCSIYARMVELVLVQRASVLRFSDEVTNISNNKDVGKYSDNVSSLYMEYIRFINQIHFHEISSQDQGIDLYQKLHLMMDIEPQAKRLEEEIGELYNYVSLQESRDTNKSMTVLTWFASILVPMTVIASIFGMNNIWFIGNNGGQTESWYNQGWVQMATIVAVTIFAFIIMRLLTRKEGRDK